MLTLDDLSQEEFSPVHLLPEPNETIVKELSEESWPGYEKPYKVTAEVFFVEETIDNGLIRPAR
jgi:hypothetical protein